MNRWGHFLCALAICVFALAGCDTTPTLPLPPPTANVSSPNSLGLVTVEGTAKSRAAMFLYNEETEAGVIGRADEAGMFVLVIEARGGDSLRLWQQLGGQDGEPRSLVVPSGP